MLHYRTHLVLNIKAFLVIGCEYELLVLGLFRVLRALVVLVVVFF